MSNTNNRICISRKIKTIRHIEHIAGHLFQDSKQGISGIIPDETLSQLHTIADPHTIIQNKELAILLEKNKLPSLKATVSDPLFNGTLYFVRITFNTPSGAFSISNADIQTAVNYSKLAVKPISQYASQYGNNNVNVSNNIIQYSVNLSSTTFNNNDLRGWVNNIVSANNLPTGSSCIVILNPVGITNTDADRSHGIGGFHGNTNTPFCFCNVYGQNFTIGDNQNIYAQILSHEIAEMVVDPLANIVNPEVCDACAGNCTNLWLDYFDNNNNFIDGSQSIPPSFNYTFLINSVIKPASYNSSTECALPGSNLHDVCVYSPSQVFNVHWLRCLYLDLLNREPDIGGLNYWINKLTSGTSSTSIADSFLKSPEYCTITAESLYAKLLDRHSDPGGLNFWRDYLVRGSPLQDAINGFCNSAEYKSRHPVPDQFVESLYNKLLGRHSDPGGFQYWVNKINSGTNTIDIINGFLRSREYALQRMTEFYQKFLGRQPDSGGLDYWAKKVQNGISLQEITKGFITSVEYLTRSQSR